MALKLVPKENAQATRSRLLEAAGELFAEKGLHNVTVREICVKAKANTAALHYHFGGMQEIYEAVLNEAFAAVDKREADSPAHALKLAPEERLKNFVRTRLMRVFDSKQPQWHYVVMMNEVIRPSGVLDSVVEQNIRPRFERLKVLVQDVAEGKLSPHDCELACFSVIAQCHFHYHSREVKKRLIPKKSESLDELADFITAFSLAAIRGLAKVPKQKG